MKIVSTYSLKKYWAVLQIIAVKSLIVSFMTQNKRYYLILITITFWLSSLAMAEIPRETRKNIIAATVYIVPYDNDLGLFQPWSGSGVIISPSGYLLTNYHVVGDDIAATHDDYHAIYMTDPNKTSELPVFKYWARFVAGLPEYDLALLKIYETADGVAVKGGFPTVPIADANELIPGDDLTIVGYPAVSGDTISVTSGEMSGWLGEDQLNAGNSWIKTDTKISGGNSGGAALNPEGEFIGIPTQFYFDDIEQVSQGYIRPINFIWGLIAAYVKDVSLADEGIKLLMLEQKADQEIKAVRYKTPKRTDFSKIEGSDSKYAELRFDQEISRYISGDEHNYVYHLYKIAVPEGTKVISIEVDGHNRDLDLAIRYDQKITDYDKTDYSDLSTVNDPVFTIFEPKAKVIYVDVINALNADSYYSLFATTDLKDDALNMIDAMPSDDYGFIALDRSFSGKLSAWDGTVIYHSFKVIVPTDKPVTVSLDGFGKDVDIAIREGEAMTSLSYNDADFLDKTTRTRLEHKISKVESGIIYIDVLNYIDQEIKYNLKVTSP